MFPKAIPIQKLNKVSTTAKKLVTENRISYSFKNGIYR